MLSPEPLTRPIIRGALQNPSVYWIFDFDNTLVDLAPVPDAITVPPQLLSDLDRLAQQFAGRVAIVSGRSAADLHRWLPLPHLTYIGNHGAEWIQNERPGHQPVSRAVQQDLDAVRIALHRFESLYPGSLLEDKSHSLSFHYRGVPSAERIALHKAMVAVLAGTSQVELRPALDCWEIRPRGGPTKGDAVRRLLRQTPAYPLIFGDDLTDEDAFAAAPPDSLTVIVGDRRPTQARFQLSSPRVLRQLLSDLITPD